MINGTVMGCLIAVLAIVFMPDMIRKLFPML